MNPFPTAVDAVSSVTMAIADVADGAKADDVSTAFADNDSDSAEVAKMAATIDDDDVVVDNNHHLHHHDDAALVVVISDVIDAVSTGCFQ